MCILESGPAIACGNPTRAVEKSEMNYTELLAVVIILGGAFWLLRILGRRNRKVEHEAVERLAQENRRRIEALSESVEEIKAETEGIRKELETEMDRMIAQARADARERVRDIIESAEAESAERREQALKELQLKKDDTLNRFRKDLEDRKSRLLDEIERKGDQ